LPCWRLTLQPRLRVHSIGIAMAPASTAMALPFTATVLRTTATVLDITAIGVGGLETPVTLPMGPGGGGEQMIEQNTGGNVAGRALETWACSPTSRGPLRRGSDPVVTRRHCPALSRGPHGRPAPAVTRPGWVGHHARILRTFRSVSAPPIPDACPHGKSIIGR